MTRRAHLRAVAGLTPVTSPNDDTLHYEQLIAHAGDFVAKRGAVRLELGIGDADGVPLPFDVGFSAAPAFRVQATAVFPGHEVVGQTRAIDRDDFYARRTEWEEAWQFIACGDLLEKLTGASPMAIDWGS